MQHRDAADVYVNFFIDALLFRLRGDTFGNLKSYDLGLFVNILTKQWRYASTSNIGEYHIIQ